VIRTLASAARWVDRVRLALLFPKADVVLPSLWEQVAGAADVPVAVRDASGAFVSWSDGMSFLWSAKDALPEEGLVCVGKHLARSVALVAPGTVPVLVAANGGEAEGDPVAEAVRELGPLTSPQLREATGLAKKDVERSVASLHHRLVLTSSHWVDEGGAWGSVAHDLLARKWQLPRRLPGRDEARREIASIVLGQAGELTAADLAGAVGWRRKEAGAVLDEIATGHEHPDGFRIWVRR
jgi:hypothetical protein